MKSVVSEKGQITIPKALRVQLGLRAGTVLEFVAEQGQLVGTKAAGGDPIRRWRGKGRLPGALSVDAYLALVRGER